EITELVRPTGDRSTVGVLSAAQAKLVALEERQRELADLRRRLEQLVVLCESGDPADCAALDVFS
ncbi:MAG: hypothetical protein JO265_12305, partial [Acidimicrobiia bacterium]|nr:hypothetical protein [Acidimicrobiia bacterium]